MIVSGSHTLKRESSFHVLPAEANSQKLICTGVPFTPSISVPSTRGAVKDIQAFAGFMKDGI
jgi:hypothetical protein